MQTTIKKKCQFLFLAFVVACCTIVFLRVYSSYKKVSHIPGGWQVTSFLFRIPIIAEYVFVNNPRRILELVKEKSESENGNVVRVSLMGRNIVYLNDKDLMKEVIVTKGHNFPKHKPPYEGFTIFGENILTIEDSSDESWRNHHKICSPAFTSQNLEYLVEYSSKSIQKLFDRWQKQTIDSSLNGKSVRGYITADIKNDFSDLTLDILGQVGFGLDFDIFSSNEHSEGVQFRKSLELLFTTGVFAKLYVGMNPLIKWAHPLVQKFYGIDSALNVVSSKLDDMIRVRKNEIELQVGESGEASDRRDLLSCLIEANYLEKGLLTDNEVKSDAFIFSLAGHDTTSTTLQWCCYELGKRLDIQQKVREEVNSILKGGKPTFDDFEKMNYLNCVVMETLRLHPPVPAGFRVAKKSTTIGKYQIPKGTIIALDLSNTNWNEKHWKNPFEFYPERFSMDFNERQRTESDFTWVPFSMGNRKCIGFKFSRYELFTLLSNLMQKYEIITLNDESNHNDRVYEVPGPTINPGNLRLMFKELSN